MAGIVIVLSDPGRRLMLGLAESHDHTTETALVATSLQTRAPTGKWFGPAAGLLLSRPMTFQVIGVAVSVANAGDAERKAIAAAAPTTGNRKVFEDL